MADKQARCKSRKSEASCMKDPETCAWAEDHCEFKQQPSQEQKPEKPKAVRCKARKSKGECEKDPPACAWEADQCVPGTPSAAAVAAAAVQKVVLVCGFPGSGKSTYARQLIKDHAEGTWVILSRDEMGGTLKQLAKPLVEALKKGKSVLLDNMHLTPVDRGLFVQAARGFNPQIRVEAHVVDASIEDCQIRHLRRMFKKHQRLFMEGKPDGDALGDPHVYPIAVLFKARKAWVPPAPAEGFDHIVVIPAQPLTWAPRIYKNKALFLDIDGTIRKTQHLPHKTPTDPSQVELLFPAADLRAVLRRALDAGYKLIGISNQSGIASGWAQEDAVKACMDRTRELIGLSEEEFPIVWCPHKAFPATCFCRKPQSGWGVHFIETHKLLPSACWMVGDMKTDETFAVRLGIPFRKATGLASLELAP